MNLEVGSIVKTKKPHPCGSQFWEIIRSGADIRLKCTGCAHQIMVPLSKIEKSIQKIYTKNEWENL